MHFFSMCSKIMRQYPPSVEEKLNVSIPFSAACTTMKNAHLYFWHQSVPLCDNSARIPLIGFHKLRWKYFTQICVNVSIIISKIGMLGAVFLFPSSLNSSSDCHEILLQKSKCNMVSQKKLKKKQMCPDITHCTHSPCMFCSHVFSRVLISHTLHKKPTADHTHSSIKTQVALNTNHWIKQ
jgi:hypothetical protein